MALAEAVAHLNRGLELAAPLAPSAERDGLELDLRVALGTAWMARRGWAAQEVWESLHPALGLARTLGRADALLSILVRNHIHVLTTGRVAESLRWATQVMEAAEAHRDPDILIGGHNALANSYFYLGELTKAREHADQVLSLHTEQRHGDLVRILGGIDVKLTTLVFASRMTWMLGFPEQAARVGEACESHARRRGNAIDLSYALTQGATVFDHLGQPDEVLRRTGEAERLGRDNRLPFVTGALVPVYSGIALIRRGQVSEGVASLRAGIASWEATGGRAASPYFKSVLAEGMAQLGDLDGALSLIGEVLAQVERPGWGERHYHAETLRIRGGILARKGDTEGAERSHAASLAWARHQQAKSFELRTATNHARLMRDQGRVGEARDLLAPVHGWFTEGFGTKDLREARALLDELG
jgi:tetratricopeptide (TPR) repeat protein